MPCLPEISAIAGSGQVPSPADTKKGPLRGRIAAIPFVIGRRGIPGWGHRRFMRVILARWTKPAVRLITPQTTMRRFVMSSTRPERACPYIDGVRIGSALIPEAQLILYDLRTGLITRLLDYVSDDVVLR